MDYARIIKERISTPELFSRYGFQRDRNGNIHCMFHPDKHASMKVYDGDRGYHCFSCKATGDVIDFVVNYFKIPFREALSKINSDFLLGLPIDNPIDVETRKRIYREIEERKAKYKRLKIEHEILQKAYDYAFDEFVRLERQRFEYAPKSPSEPFHDLFVEAVTKIDSAEQELEDAHTKLYMFEKQKR